MIALLNGGALTTGTTELTSGYTGLIKSPTTVSILSYNRYSTDNFNIKWTLKNNNYIKAYTNNGNWIIKAFNSNDVELANVALGMSNWDIPVCAFLVRDDITDKYYMVVGQYAITQGQPLQDDMVFNTAIKTYPDGQPVNPLVNHYALNNDWTDVFTGAVVEDENELDGTSTTGGGGGSFDNNSDNIGIPSLPSFNVLSSSAISIYNIDSANLTKLGSFLFSDDFVSNIKKAFNNPMENILNLSIAPITNDVQIEGSNAIVKIGNVLATDTHGDLVASQFYEIDLGTLDIQEHWGSALDYEPYTRATLYLPYANAITLDIDKVMNRTLGVKYHTDIITGDFIAFVTADNQLINVATGNLKTSISLSGTDYTQNTMAKLQTVTGLASTIGGVATGNPLLTGSGVTSVASGVMNSKPNYTQTGSNGCTFGLMGLQYAYVVFERINQCLPTGYKSFDGYPSYITETLSSLTGFTKVNNIHLAIEGALTDELDEIERLLKGGVYI